MGLWQTLLDAFGLGGRKLNVLIVGLDNSGKSTILEHLKPRRAQAAELAPTVGFSVEEIRSKGFNLTVFDMSGAGKYRSLWEQYYQQAQAVIFVVDAADRLRMVVVKDELDSLLANKQLAASAPLLVFANKQDLPTALTASEVAQALQLDSIKDKPWQITSSNALLGQGLDNGMEWLAQALQRQLQI